MGLPSLFETEEAEAFARNVRNLEVTSYKSSSTALNQDSRDCKTR